MAPDPVTASSSSDPEAPVLPIKLPSREKLKVAAECFFWVIILSLYPCGVLIYQWLEDPFDRSIDWQALYHLARACAVPAAVAFYLKHRAWLLAPPGTKVVQTIDTKKATIRTDDGTVTRTIEQKTEDVQPRTDGKVDGNG